jgi:protease I
MRIACVLASGFEDTEYRVPVDRFRAAGHEVVTIGERRAETLVGKSGRERVRVDLSVDAADPSSFDALFIPGGYAPDRLRADPRMVAFARAFAGRPIFAICHGPQLLISADMVRGRTMTAWRTVRTDLAYAGAHVVDREVVVDGNLVTSRQPSDAEAFAREALALLGAGAPVHI